MSTPTDFARSSPHLAKADPEWGVPRKAIAIVASSTDLRCASALFFEANRAYLEISYC